MRLKTKFKFIFLFIFFCLFFYSLDYFIDERNRTSIANKLENAFNRNTLYYPSEYYSLKGEDFCFSQDLGCGNWGMYDDRALSPGQQPNKLVISIRLKGEANKKRIMEIGEVMLQRYNFRPIEIHFIINGKDLPFFDVSSNQVKEITWAILSMRKVFLEPKLDLFGVRWHSEGIKALIKELQLDLQRNNEKLLGVWIPTQTANNLGPNPTYMMFLIKKKNLIGKLKWDLVTYKPGGKYYLNKTWFSSKEKNKFIFNIFNLSCDLNECGDLIVNTRRGIFNFENFLMNDSLLN